LKKLQSLFLKSETHALNLNPSDMHSTSYIPSTLVVVLFLFLFPTTLVSGYASWLKCYIDLDPTEVVMHHTIVEAENARERVTIQVQDYYGSTEWSTGDDYTLPRRSQSDDRPITLKVRLQVPASLESQSVQFVIELVGLEQKKEGGEDVAPAAEFVDRGVMCDGGRAFSQRHDEHVVLTIPATTNTTPQPIQLVAIWAAGYEAVSLTPVLTLLEPPSSGSSSSGDREL
jgi:hypothetical protein